MSCWKNTQWKMASDVTLAKRSGFGPGDIIEGREFYNGEPRPRVKILSFDREDNCFPIVVEIIRRPGLLFQRPREIIEEDGKARLSLGLRDWRKIE